MTTSDETLLISRIHADLGEDHERWFDPEGYQSVALAILDSIYSTGHHYTSVLNAVEKYRAARRAEGADPQQDTAQDLIDATNHWGGTEGLVERTNRWPVSTKPGAPRKADAAYGAAQALVRHDLITRPDVVRELSDPARQEAAPIKKEWLALPGQGSGLTWTYFLMLCGVPGVKADRMIVRYVSEALGRSVDSRTAAVLVGAVADQMPVTRSKLDHAIWRKESGREVYINDEPT